MSFDHSEEDRKIAAMIIGRPLIAIILFIITFFYFAITLMGLQLGAVIWIVASPIVIYYSLNLYLKWYTKKLRSKSALQKWRKTTPGLFDMAQQLSNVATKLFENKKYDTALLGFEESLSKFIQAKNGAEGLKDEGLAKAIENNIYSVKKSIIASKNAIGISLSEEAKKSFDTGDYEATIDTYKNAMAKLESAIDDAKEIEEYASIEKNQELIKNVNENIENCYIAIDKREVENLFKESESLHEKAAELAKSGELFKAKDILRESERKLNTAFDIGVKRKFSDAVNKLNLLLDAVRNEMNIIDKNISSGVAYVDFDKDVAKIRAEGAPEITIDLPDMHETFPQVDFRGASELEIKRDYVILENKDLRFGILVKNISKYTVNDVDVLLKYDRSLFSLKDKDVKPLGNITKNGEKTATYILTPLVGCIHRSKIDAIISYKDASDNSRTVQMRPKEVHCISPFLVEKPMTEGEFSRLYENQSCLVEGIVFKGIGAEAVTNFIVDSSRNRHYLVKNSFVNGTHIIYLSSAAKDKSFYLLTVIIRNENNLTHVGLRACSNNEGGINNFVSEVLTSLRHYVNSVQSAREVENITNNISVQIINSEVHGGVSIGGDAYGRDESFNYGSRR